MPEQILKGSTNESVTIRIIDSIDGSPEQAVEHDSAGIAMWYRRELAVRTTITPVALAALTTVHADGGIEHIDDGYYRFDVDVEAGDTINLRASETVTAIRFLRAHLILVGA